MGFPAFAGLGKIGAEMAAAAFGALEGRGSDQRGRGGHVEISAGDLLGRRLQMGNLAQGGLEAFGIALDPDEVSHDAPEVLDGNGIAQHFLGAVALGLVPFDALEGGEVARRLKPTNVLGNAGAIDDCFQKRIGGEAISAVETRAGGFAADPEAGQGGAPTLVDLDPAHVEMGRGGDRDHAVDRVDAGVRAVFADGGKAGEDGGAQGGARVEIDLSTRLDLAEIGAGDDVPRGQFGVWMDGGHEALAQIIDEDSAFAAQRLGGEGRRIGTGRNGGGMELDEFGIGNDSPGTGRHTHGMAAHAGRIGGDGIKAAQAAGGQHGGAGADEDGLGIAVAQLAAIDADDAAIVAGEITTKATVDYQGIARQVIREVGYIDDQMGICADTCAVLLALNRQSPDIAQGVNDNAAAGKDIGAGDQGMMFG